MSRASWLPVSLLHAAPRLNKESRLQPCRRPTRSRPFLEPLEERTLLDASSGIIPGAASLASNFAPASIGIALPTGPNFPNTTGVTTQSFPNAGGQTALAATSALMSQNQINSQFRDFAVNSQGETNQLSQTMANILLDAYGFGSGTQPNAPWAPAAYNLGLGNHQYGYPSQSDVGFSATPPWFHPTAQSLPKDQLLDAENDADLTPESQFIHLFEKEGEPDQQPWTDDDTRDQNNSEKAAPEKQMVPDAAAPDLPRGGPAVEEALFTDEVWATSQNPRNGSISEDETIPSPLVISAVSPAQMAALVAGLPGVVAPAEGGDVNLAEAGPE